MKKKSPKGIKGFHAWQMRWFELTKLKLAYWEVAGPPAPRRALLPPFPLW